MSIRERLLELQADRENSHDDINDTSMRKFKRSIFLSAVLIISAVIITDLIIILAFLR